LQDRVGTWSKFQFRVARAPRFFNPSRAGAGRRYVADFAWSGFSAVIARESGR
jgi:hypothetical protein